MADFYLKRHDLLPTLQAILQDSSGAPVNLTGATVVFNMKNTTGAIKISRAAVTIITAAAGLVEYAWSGTDTDTSGTFQAEFEADFAGPKPETFPNTSYISISIADDLA